MYKVKQRNTKQKVRSGRRLKVSLGMGALLILFALVSCYPIPDVWSDGKFLGNLTGYVVLEDGTPLGLRIKTQLQTKEEHRYTFTGQALLEGTSYRLEGEERTDDGRLHYQAVPPPTANLSATFFGSDDTPRYRLEMMIPYGSWYDSDEELEGVLYQGEAQFGRVRLRKE